ncbi:hypothetical protein Tco_1421739, partial [Tanacetum coccineum]
GTNYPVALDRQDRVTTKLKTANPSLDTSISWKVSQRKVDYLFKLRSVAWKITINPLTTFDLKQLILSLKLQRLQTLIISSHKCLRSQAYKTKILARALGSKVECAVSRWDIGVQTINFSLSAKTS